MPIIPAAFQVNIADKNVAGCSGRYQFNFRARGNKLSWENIFAAISYMEMFLGNVRKRKRNCGLVHSDLRGTRRRKVRLSIFLDRIFN